jgi:Na+/proline symporter/signal transduction histidine kinase
MLSADLVVATALIYVAFLFAVAFYGDRRARQGRLGWLRSPIVYTLSISIYCTSWTYYGMVGSAAHNGIEFATIYLGPMLVFVGWWFLLRKLVRIGQIHRITSIADMISSRYGKSAGLAALVTVIAVAASTPYIALQLKAVTTSFQVVSGAGPTALAGFYDAQAGSSLAFWVAAGMAVFTILFGTRNIDANERHHGVVAAIAVEAVVKLAAMLGVGLLVVFGIAGGPAEIFARMPPDLLRSEQVLGPRWVTLTFLSAAAIVCLPRQFQVTVVEISDERHLRTASWLFPLYLFLITLFVLPIAIGGLAWLPAGANPDMFMLTLPMWANRPEIALLTFLGGFSAATSMVIVASIALSTMVSNHVIVPVALRLPWVAQGASGDVRRLLLRSRRISICLILLLGYLHLTMNARFNPIASIGLTAFAGVAQLLPCLLGGLFWRQATARGAATGLAVGAAVWAFTLLLPSFKGEFLLPAHAIEHGLFGVRWLRPYALFGLEGLDPLVHSVFWSLTLNTLLFVAVSLLRAASPLERLQSALFVDVFRHPVGDTSRFVSRSAATYDLNILAQRLIGVEEARRLFDSSGRGLRMAPGQPIADDALITELERKLAGSVGAASARTMISQVVTGETISLSELLKIADETERVRRDSRQLEAQSRQLAETAGELRTANERLTQLDRQKDDFLTHVSHEVRTPMTSIRSFSEILLQTEDLERRQSQRFLRIIHDESLRMTRLLDGILELSVLERGAGSWTLAPVDPELALANAIDLCEGLATAAGVRVLRGAAAGPACVMADGDRLSQVFINLISNAIKYNTSPEPFVRIDTALHDGRYEVRVSDNGPGIRADERGQIFTKFSRGWAHTQSGKQGAGLGLAISWQIMRRLGGTLELLPDGGSGACFRARLSCCDPLSIGAAG